MRGEEEETEEEETEEEETEEEETEAREITDFRNGATKLTEATEAIPGRSGILWARRIAAR